MNPMTADHLAHPPPSLTRNWARLGFWLVVVTMAYNVAEGAIAFGPGCMQTVLPSWALGSIAISSAPPPLPSYGI
jgi:hypothetical protein